MTDGREATMSQDGNSERAGRAGRREWIALAVLALPCMLVTMDLTVLFLALPELTADLRPSSTEILWISDIYGFLIAGMLIVMGALGDRIGRRRLLLTGGAAFGVASVLAALSASAEMLIAARALQGLAGATLLPSIMALVFAMFTDERQRTGAIGLIMSCFAAGAGAGPLIGGALLEVASWGWVFAPNVPVMMLLLVLGPRVLPEFRNPDAGRIDLGSAALSIVAILPVVYGIKELASDGPSTGALAAIGLGLGAAAAFLRRERRLSEPLVDLALFRVRAFNAALVANLAGVLVMYGIFFFTTQYLQLVLGLSPLEAGLWGLPGVAAMMVASALVVPRLASHVRPAYLMSGGIALAAAGILALAALDADSGLALFVPAMVIASVGLAPAATLGTNLILGTAPPERTGAASGLAEAGNELSGALGIALLGSLGLAIYRGDVEERVDLAALPPGTAEAVRDSLGGAASVADRIHEGALEATYTAFAHGLHVAALVGAAVLAAAAVVAAVFLRHVPAAAPAEPEPEPASPHLEPAPAVG